MLTAMDMPAEGLKMPWETMKSVHAVCLICTRNFNLFGSAFLWKQSPQQRYHDRHTFVIATYHRSKKRLEIQSCYSLHLWQMLMIQSGRIRTRGTKSILGCIRLILRNQFLAAAAITGYGMQCHRIVRLYQPFLNKRIHFIINRVNCRLSRL